MSASNHAEVLQRVAAFLTPDNLDELTSGVRSLYDGEVPGVGYEARKEVKLSGLYGGYSLDYGKASIAIGQSLFAFSDLAEVEWRAPTAEGGQAVVQASADFSGNNRPSLVIFEYPNLETKAGGRTYSPKEAAAIGWLGQFLYKLALVDAEVYKFWNRPRESKGQSWHCIDGVWQRVS